MPDHNGISGTNTSKTTNYRTEKPKFLIITNSVSSTKDEAAATLLNKGASVHYFIDKDGKQYEVNLEDNQSFTCGKSQFRGEEALNNTAITLMFINSGNEAYTVEQKGKFIAFLNDFKGEKRKPDIDLKINLLGLGEVAIIEAKQVEKDGKQVYLLGEEEIELKEGHGKIFPHHIAPGKIFWQELAEQLADLGFGLFCSTTPKEKAEILFSPEKGSKQDILALQKNLQKYGFAIQASGIYDAATEAWVTRFNQRYVPGNTVELNAVWTQASQLSLDYILPFILAETHAATQSQSVSTVSSSRPQSTLFATSAPANYPPPVPEAAAETPAPR